MLTFVIFKNQPKALQDDVVDMLWDFWKEVYIKSDITTKAALWQKLNTSYACLIMRHQEYGIVGSVTITIDTPIETFHTNYWIGDLFIRKEFRKMKLGSIAMQLTEKYLRSRNVSVAYLWCHEPLIGFYTKNQWILSPFDKYGDKHTMIKML